MSKTIVDISGQTFSAWTVVGSVIRTTRHALWPCRCICGTERDVASWSLRSGLSRSCGCVSQAAHIQRITTHGMTGSKIFNAYLYMKSRCLNPKVKCFKDYGGRGITICDRWLESFENFYADMGPSHRDWLTLERKDNNKGYDPDNCEWASRAKQSRNRRMCIMIDSPWGRMTISEAARNAGIKEMTLYQRIKKALADGPYGAPTGNRQ